MNKETKLKREEIKNIISKAHFIQYYSNVIYAKLINQNLHDITLSNLQQVLLSDGSLDEHLDIVQDLKSGNGIMTKKSSYELAMEIIFEVCKEINNQDFSNEEKAAFRNKLRAYPKKFIIKGNYNLSSYVSFDNEAVKKIEDKIKIKK